MLAPVLHDQDTPDGSSPELHVRTRTDRRVGLRLAGELDGAIRDELAALLDQELLLGRYVVQIDLQRVTFVDASVIGVFASVDARCRSLGSGLVLIGATPSVLRVLALCGLDHLVSPSAFASTPA